MATATGNEGSSLTSAKALQQRLRLRTLRGVDLHEQDLRGADLVGAAMGEANLQGAWLDAANLAGADLAGANLQGALLAETDLSGALLEDANLVGAAMRFAKLNSATLEGADLRGADLWGACLDDAVLERADLTRCVLNEATLRHTQLTNANLSWADLGRADFAGAVLANADLTSAKVSAASFRGAVLSHGRLERLDLTECDLTNVHLSGAWLDQTRLRLEQLGGTVGEEVAGDYNGARYAYLALETNFRSLGDFSAASWSYRKRRRMEKRCEFQASRLAFKSQSWFAALRGLTSGLQHQALEWLCDYGEGIGRVLLVLALTFGVFTVIYGLSDSVVRIPTDQAARVSTREPLDLVIFSLLAMTAATPAVGLAPASATVHLLTGVQALVSIFLTGLLGFVVGNRIHR
jgi:uncharacterized protein YjbI with pentapeptide repeats